MCSGTDMAMVDVARSGGGDPALDDVGFREWMTGRASSLARRRPWRRERSFDTVPDSVDPTSEGAIAAVEERDGPLVAALAALPAGQRAVVVLRFTDDLSVEGIAQVLGIPVGTVKSRLSRGIETLRAHLDASGDLATRTPPLDPATTVVPVTENRS